MRHARLSSSTIRLAEYDDATRALTVTFTNGHRYAYSDVPADLYDALIAASSAGAFFNDHIRDRFACARADGRRSYPRDDDPPV